MKGLGFLEKLYISTQALYEVARNMTEGTLRRNTQLDEMEKTNSFIVVDSRLLLFPSLRSYTTQKRTQLHCFLIELSWHPIDNFVGETLIKKRKLSIFIFPLRGKVRDTRPEPLRHVSGRDCERFVTAYCCFGCYCWCNTSRTTAMCFSSTAHYFVLYHVAK